jgi:MFS family permease
MAPAMPHVVNDLGGAGLYPWVFTTYLIGVSLFLVGSVLCALSPSMVWMVACRALQALGAIAATVSAIVVFPRFPRERSAPVEA